jgi:hypothetical protein
MFPQKILTFHSWENIYLKVICLIEIWITCIPKELAKFNSKSQINTVEKEIINSMDPFCSYNLEIWVSRTTVIS